MGIEPTTHVHGFISTLIYTSELILCFIICVYSATRHNIQNILTDHWDVLDLLEWSLTHWVTASYLSFHWEWKSIKQLIWKLSSLHETIPQGTVVVKINIAKEGTVFVTMLSCNRVSQEELTS